MLYLEILGTIAFAVSGAIEAMKKEMDILGVCVMGLVTAVGGGILRDCMIGEFPPAIFQNVMLVSIALISALLAFFAGWFIKPKKEKTIRIWNQVFLISDAIGLGAFTVLGIRYVQEVSGYSSLLLLMFMGVITGVGGGVLRDLFAGNVPYIFRKHIYATASIVGAVLYLCLQKTGYLQLAQMVSVLAVVCLRLLAAKYRWNLPCVHLGK